MNTISTSQDADRLLGALGEQLAAVRQRFELVIVGGTALLVLGASQRATRDVDVVALVDATGLSDPDPFPADLATARDRVARDFSLPDEWLNAGPSDLLRFGLPEGFLVRAEPRSFGEYLEVRFASRIDQIYLKLYAAVDQGPGKHSQDLEALKPTAEELVAAAGWARTHDPSEGFNDVLRQVLDHYGVTDGSSGA